MLQSIRDRATGPIAWFIVALITVPFAFWGIDSYVSAPTNPEVAEVGSTDITRVQLQRAYDQSYQRLQQLMGDGFKPDAIDTNQLRRGVLDNLIQETLLNQHARKAGYRVSDVQIMQNLRSQEAFQVDGSFSPQRYRDVLARSGYTPASYEQQLRQALAVDQLQGGLSSSAFVTERDVDAALRLKNQQRQISYLHLPYSHYMAKAEISDKDVEARYAVDAQNYRTEERLQIAFVELNKSSLQQAEPPEAEVLRAIYEVEVNARFTKPERRHARHILVRVDEERNEAVAKKLIQSLSDRLNDGEDFTSVASKESDDLGSKTKGGDLGWVARGVMVPEFEEALFGLDKGVVSAPVLTSFGWHLILVEDIQSKQVQAFDDPEVQDQLLTLYRERELGERFEQLAKQLDELSFDYPDSLEQVAKALGLEVQQSDWFTRNKGTGLGSNTAVREAAFSSAVLDNKENSAPLKLASDRLVVIRVAEHEPAQQRPLAVVADEIREELVQEFARDQATENAEKAIAKLRSGVSMKSVAAGMGLTEKNAIWVTRDSQKPELAIVQAAFRLPRPDQGKPVFEVVTMGDGNAIVALNDVRDGDPASASVEERETMKRNLLAAQAQAEFRSYLEAAKDDISVEIHEDQI